MFGVVFFFKQKTAYEMRISDWSSDVCSSDLILSFEPNPDIFSELERNASSDRRWHVFNMALSDFDGMASFNIMAADQFSSLKAPSGEQVAIFAERNRVTRTVDMQCPRLESLLPALRRAHGLTRPFLKMDTQGPDLRSEEPTSELQSLMR